MRGARGRWGVRVGQGVPLSVRTDANGRFWADSGRAPVRAPISAHLLAQRVAKRKSVQVRRAAGPDIQLTMLGVALGPVPAARTP
jgi:hypothetical protein